MSRETNMERRAFLRAAGALAVAGATGCAGTSAGAGAASTGRSDRTGLHILILGGTGFLGPHFVRAAVARGHVMTLFNRGKTNPHLFPELERLRGDRNGDLKALEGREWDAVVDTSGYFPRQVRDSAGLLREAVSQYLFVSSISVYPNVDREDVDERTPVGRIENEDVDEITGETYGPLKALCEEAAGGLMPGRVTNVRPGLIVGPGDPSDRFTYWPARVSRGGEVLAPDPPEATVDFIDARDLADFMLACLEREIVGVYNATGPLDPLPLADLLGTCKDVSRSNASFTWCAPTFLAEQGVRAWADLPLWTPIPAGWERSPLVSRERAVKRGLCFRPLEITVGDTLEWHEARGDSYVLRTGIAPERERAVLAAWHAREESASTGS